MQSNNDEERLARLERELSRDDPRLARALVRAEPGGGVVGPVAALVVGFLAVAWLFEWPAVAALIAIGMALAMLCVVRLVDDR